MRRGFIIAVAVAVALGAAWWWGRQGAPPAGPARETDEQAAERFEKLRAQLNAMPSAPLPAPSGDLEIGGQVIGSGGPLPGATVTATRAEPGETLSELPCPDDLARARTLLDPKCSGGDAQLAQLVAERRGEAQPVARATADAEGRFTLRGLAPGRYALWADAPRGVSLKPDVAAGTSGHVLSIGAGRVLHGRVVDAQEHPIEGAVVTAVLGGQARFFDAVSGPDGKVSLGPFPPEPCVVIGMSAALLPDVAHHVEWERPFTLTLRAPRRLRGQVLHRGAPVAGAEVSAEHGRDEARVKTDREGRFELARLLPGPYRLRATAGTLQASRNVLVPTFSEPPEQRVELDEGGVLAGVVRVEAGAMLPGATVLYDQTEADGSWGLGRISTGPDGAFRAEPVAPGEYQLAVMAKGFDQGRRWKATVRARETTTVEISLRPPAVVEGTVLGPDEAPLVGVTVRAADQDLDAEAVTDAQGHFTIEGLEPDSAVVEAVHPDHAVAAARVKVPSAGVVIRLTRGFTLDGRVIDDSGVPVEGAYVKASRPRSPRDAPLEPLPHLPAATADALGAFHLHGLPAGPITLVTTRSGLFWQEWPHPSDAELPSPAPVTIRLPPAGRIAGTAMDEEGQPLSGIQVVARPSEKTIDAEPDATLVVAVTTTDERGAFDFSGQELGEYRLRSGPEGYDPTDVTARTGDLAVRLVMKQRPVAVVRGRVLDPDGAPVTSFTVNGSRREDPAGELRRDRRTDREMVLHIVADDPELLPAERRVPPGPGDYPLGDVVLGRGRRLTGRVLDAATGAPVGGASIALAAPPRAVGVGPYDPHPARSCSDGSFEVLLGDPPGDLQVTHLDYAPAVVRAPGNGALEVRLEPLGRIVGEVEGPIIRMVPVVAVGSDLTAPRYGEVEGDGHFVIRGVKPGPYVVRLSAAVEGSGTVLPVEATVPERGEVHVTLVRRDGEATLHVRVRGAGPDGSVRVLLVPGARGMPSTFEELMRVAFSSLQPPGEGESLEFQRVPPGAYTLFAVLVDRGKAQISSAPVTVGAQEQTVEIAAPTEGRAIDMPARPP